MLYKIYYYHQLNIQIRKRVTPQLLEYTHSLQRTRTPWSTEIVGQVATSNDVYAQPTPLGEILT